MEKIAEIIDRIENLRSSLSMPIPDAIHVQALREALPELHQDLKAAYLDAGGEDFWGC